jgi:Tfp pilus assembly protein PilV
MKRNGSRRGMTLVEILIAAVLMVLTVTAAMAMFPMTNLLRNKSGNYSRASTLIARKLEQVRTLRSDQITYNGLRAAAIIDAGDVQPYKFTTTDGLASEMPEAKGTITVTNPGTQLVTVDVTVTWRGLRGNTQSLTATTYVANKTVWKVVQ